MVFLGSEESSSKKSYPGCVDHVLHHLMKVNMSSVTGNSINRDKCIKFFSIQFAEDKNWRVITRSAGI